MFQVPCERKKINKFFRSKSFWNRFFTSSQIFLSKRNLLRDCSPKTIYFCEKISQKNLGFQKKFIFFKNKFSKNYFQKIFIFEKNLFFWKFTLNVFFLFFKILIFVFLKFKLSYAYEYKSVKGKNKVKNLFLEMKFFFKKFYF